jgi:hypothetical protein
MRFTRPKFSRIATVAAGGVALALFMSSPAMADTSQSSATALQLTLVGGSLANSGTTTASNDGTTETDTGNTGPSLSILGTQPVISAGVLGQVSRAFADGSAAACAGVVGAGGAITVGATGNCLVTNGTTVTLTLGTIAIAGVTTAITLTADAIYANCGATSAPSATGGATLANAKISGTALGVTTTLLNLTANPGANTTLGITGVLTATLNAQSTPTTGQINVTALQISALGGALASVTIGAVTCGPDAAASPVPSIPLKGLPVALGLGGVLIGGVLLLRRLRATAV